MNQAAALKAGERCPTCGKEVRYPLSHVCHPSDLRKMQLRAAEKREELARDARFIATPNDWVRWPLLPMKRGGSGGQALEVGLMFSGDLDKGEVVIYEGLNLYQGIGCSTYADFFAKAKARVVFTGIPALQAAGWRVD